MFGDEGLEILSELFVFLSSESSSSLSIGVSELSLLDEEAVDARR
jgi:hypothetical protein